MKHATHTSTRRAPSDQGSRHVLALWAAVVGMVTGIAVAAPARAAEKNAVDFNRDIRPILSDNCFACHGPDATHRKAKLRLDTREGAFALHDGAAAITPGKPEQSTAFVRITSKDPADRMPPPESHKKLKPKQVDLIRRWIEQGAPWSAAWAYEPPVKTEPGRTADPKRVANFIDAYIQARLASEGLEPAPPAHRVTLIRRLSFDLTGLPPTPAEVDAFVNDRAPDAYEKVVDRLLASPHFGERMAIWWLDLVRFADTVGYHGDQDHNIWPYRDYVIDAFNTGLPFDQFTVDQLAGDLTPGATQTQRVASGYNRLLQTSHEGGVQAKEYRAIYQADRVRNVSQVWMGATVGCAQCHDHKFDPYTMTDFYAMGAIFADIDDEQHLRNGTNSLPTRRSPEIRVYTPQQREQLAALEPKIAALEPTVRKLDADRKKQDTELKQQDDKIKRLNAELKKLQTGQKAETAAARAKRDQIGRQLNTIKLVRDATVALRNKAANEHKQANARLAPLVKQRDAIHKAAPLTMVTQALATPRPVRLLPRGDWLDDSGPIVQPAAPQFLGSLSAGEGRATRLHFARWLVTPRVEGGVGELTARVQANRFWALLMGVGIARVLDDFGGQGEPPVHPDLLDRLALAFIDSGWDVKHLLKLIVMSNTYRQSSRTSSELAQRDPDNRLYARQSRPRLPAEMVRDNALAISGLLVRDIGGPSVKPYQPAKYYQHLNFPTRTYRSHTDQRQWRRGVYVHWQRQFLHPMLKAFDAPSREECSAERPVSNTPLASLVLLNDPTFVEAARVFALRVLREGGDNDASRIDWAFRMATSRKPSAAEAKLLTDLLAAHRAEFAADAQAAAKLQGVGLAKQNAGADGGAPSATEAAAWTSVARVLLNLNETITRN